MCDFEEILSEQNSDSCPLSKDKPWDISLHIAVILSILLSVIGDTSGIGVTGKNKLTTISEENNW